MKYLFLFLTCLMAAGCSTKDNRLFVCANPEMLLQSVRIDASDAHVRVHPDTIEVRTEDRNRIYLPRSLCMTVVEAQ